MKNKKSLIALAVFVLAIGGVLTTVYLTRQQQDVRSRAQVTNDSSSTCTTPGAVTNVQITYPNCQGQVGGQCDLNSASCSWDPVTGAASYTYAITDTGSGQSVQTNTLQAPTVQVTFPVTQGKTYKCDVNAVNSCGTSGGTGTDTLLCQVNALLTSPTPTPTPGVTPVLTAPPIATTPTPTAAPSVVLCGASPCDATHTCQLGLVCVQATNGQSYCAQGAYQSACQQNPSAASCCFAPPATPRPTPPAAGDSTGTILVSGASVLLFLIGGALLLL